MRVSFRPPKFRYPSTLKGTDPASAQSPLAHPHFYLAFHSHGMYGLDLLPDGCVLPNHLRDRGRCLAFPPPVVGMHLRHELLTAVLAYAQGLGEIAFNVLNEGLPAHRSYRRASLTGAWSPTNYKPQRSMSLV